MSILGKIFGKIFPSMADKPEVIADAGVATSSTVPGTPAAPGEVLAAQAPMQQVDVEAMLNDKASRHSEKLNWRTSIVDLMKLLDLDSSLGERKELAKELGYTADTSDSAAMNVWLHRQVMNKLAANGGKVPADLKD